MLVVLRINILVFILFNGVNIHPVRYFFHKVRYNDLRLFVIILFSLLLILSNGVKLLAQTNAKQAVAKLQTTFIYNFTKYIEWPFSYKQGDFVIGIVGDETSLLIEMKKMASFKKVGTQDIIIKNYKTINDISRCNILFLPKKECEQIAAVINKINGNSTLLITEKEGMTKKGAAINFVNISIRLAFELSKANVEKYDLQVSSSLLRLATDVK